MKSCFLYLRSLKCLLFLTGFACIPFLGTAQSPPVEPIKVKTFQAFPPAPVYLEDFASGLGNITLELEYNDEDDHSRDFLISFTLQNSMLRLQTDVQANLPAVTLTHEVPVTLTLQELAVYLQPESLIIEGSSASVVRTSGQLPEGMYTLSVQFFDYNSRQPVSLNPAFDPSVTIWVVLNDPPRPLFPESQQVMVPNDEGQILFQWQEMPPQIPIDGLMNYQLRLFEMLDEEAGNPLNAIQDQNVRLVFESEMLNTNTYAFSLQETALEKGKIYLWQVQARQEGEKQFFKNGGFSEISWYRYGYPEGGEVSQLFPPDHHIFSLNALRRFEWSAPDNKVEQQPFHYQLRMVEWDPQDSSRQFDELPVWFSYETPMRRSEAGDFFELREKRFNKMQHYAWQVTCISGQQVVAQSEVRTFQGPPLLNSFRAGGIRVKIIELTNPDPDVLSGRGEFQIGEKQKVEVFFDSVQVYDPGNTEQWYLKSGTIKSPLSDFEPISLKATVEENGTAYFKADSLKLNRNGLFLGGKAYWEFPHPTTSKEKPQAVSKFEWLSYNAFQLVGTLDMDETVNQFALLDPYGFELHLNENSQMEIFADEYSILLEGHCILPDKLQTRFSKPLEIPFASDQLHYIYTDALALDDELHLLTNTGLYLLPTAVFLDFSELKSPGFLKKQADWKGMYVQQADLIMQQQLDENGRMELNETRQIPFSSENESRQHCWVEASGLHFELEAAFEENASLYSFPIQWQAFSLKIDQNEFQEGNSEGEILLPLFGEESHYQVSQPLTVNGFEHAVLHGLDGSRHIFNENQGDQEVWMTVENALLENDHLLMQVSLEWPSLDIKLPALRELRFWGNYELGFVVPNGVQALDKQVAAEMKGYPVIVDAVAAGADEGVFSFAISSKIQMGEDVSGKEGLPSVNIYAVIENALAPPYMGEERDLQATEDIESVVSAYESEVVVSQQEALAQAEHALSELLEKAKMEKENNASSSLKIKMSDVLTLPLQEQEEETSPTDVPTQEVGGIRKHLTEGQRQFVDEMVQAIITELLKPVTDPIRMKTDTLCKKIRENIMGTATQSTDWLDEKIHELVMGMAEPIAEQAVLPPHDYSHHIIGLGESVSDSLSLAFTASFHEAVEVNIMHPIEETIRQHITATLIAHIEETAYGLAFQLMNGETSSESISDHGDKTLKVLKAIADSVYQEVIDPEALKGMVVETAKDTYEGVNPDRIGIKLRRALEKHLSEMGSEVVGDLAEDLANELLGDQLGLETDINFSGVGDALLSGDLSKIQMDSIGIKMESSVMKFNGLLGFREEDEKYGDVWQGNILLVVKKPNPFAIKGYYMTGRQENRAYWFAQLSTTNSSDDMKAPMQKKAKALDNPANLGLVQLVGAAGRVYKHMLEDSTGLMLPDMTMTYGAYLHFVLFDQMKSGKNMRLEVGGEIDEAANGDIRLELSGNLQIQNEDPKMETIDELAMTKGNIDILYNSGEEHFYGKATVVVNHESVCAEGMLMVDVRPENWRVAIGTREERISIVPGCMGWGGVGWLDVNEYAAELGLGLSLSVYAERGFDFGVVGVNLALDAGVAAMVMARMRYDPKISLMEAGIIAEVWASIYAHWKAFGIEKSSTLVDIYCQGALIMKFEPSPIKLTGTFSGYVRLLGIGKNFSMEYETELG